jgi:hypothetical protein
MELIILLKLIFEKEKTNNLNNLLENYLDILEY